jgi:hypothetical protein
MAQTIDADIINRITIQIDEYRKIINCAKSSTNEKQIINKLEQYMSDLDFFTVDEIMKNNPETRVKYLQTMKNIINFLFIKGLPMK